MKQELEQHKKSDGVKWALTAVAFLLVAVILAGLCLQVFATSDKWKPSEWFKKDEQTEPLPEENGENAFVQDTQECGIKLKSAERVADGAAQKGTYILTATITPENADNKLLNWSVAWQNPNSEWASGKTVSEYFSLTCGADNADATQASTSYNEVTAKALESFGEPIVVTVRSCDNEALYATKTFGYLKKAAYSYCRIAKDGELGSVERIVCGDNAEYTVKIQVSLTAGTVSPSIEIKPFMNDSNRHMGMYFRVGCDAQVPPKYISFLEEETFQSTESGDVLLYTYRFTSTAEFWAEKFWGANYTLADFREYIAEWHGMETLVVTLDGEFTYGEYSSEKYTFLVDEMFVTDISLLKIGVENVSFSGSDVYF